MRKTLLCGGISAAVFGIFFMLLLVSFNWILYPIVEKSLILQELDLKIGSETFETWVRKVALMNRVAVLVTPLYILSSYHFSPIISTWRNEALFKAIESLLSLKSTF